MNKLKYIKIEKEDGNLSEKMPIGADASNIDTSSGSNVEDELISIKNKNNIQDNTLIKLQNQIIGLADNSPIPANGIEQMLDTSKIYVNIQDGMWYYYYDSKWNEGGIYQTLETGFYSIDISKMTIDIQNLFTPIGTDIDLTTVDTVIGYHDKNSGVLQSSSGFHTYYIPVVKDEIYYIKTKYMGNTRQWMLMDINKNRVNSSYEYPHMSEFISPFGDNATYVKVPSDVAYIAVSNSDSYTEKIIKKVSSLSINELNNLRNDIEKLNTDIEYNKINYILPNLKPLSYSVWNGSPIIQTENNITLIELPNDNIKYSGIYYQINNIFNNEEEINFSFDLLSINGSGKLVTLIQGKGQDGYTTISTTQIDNIGFYQIKITSSDIYESYRLLMYNNKLDTNINYTIQNEKCWRGDYDVNIVSSTWYDYILKYYDSEDTNLITLKTKVNNIENSINDINFITTEYGKRIIELQERNDFSWKNFDKVYLTMTFDDSNTDIGELQDMAEELEIPICWATIPEKLNNICSNGETVQEVLQRSVSSFAGGEVLAHTGNFLSESSSDADYYHVYITSKKILEEAGFDINGIITAGGTGYETQNFHKDVELARLYYQYADRSAESNELHDIEQFWNPRHFTDSGIDAIKEYIDNYISIGNGWINLASHGTNNSQTPNINAFKEILQYALDNNIKIVTWKYLYDNFKSSKLEQKIETLNI